MENKLQWWIKLTEYICFREDRSEELRKVHESKMLYLNKTQTDKVVKVTQQLTCIISCMLSYIFLNVSDDPLCGKHHANIAICRQRRN